MAAKSIFSWLTGVNNKRRRTGKKLAGCGQRIHGSRGYPSLIALLSHDAKIAELETTAVAHEHVHRCEIAVKHLAAMQLPEHFEDAGDLSSCGRLGPRALVALEERAEISVRRVLECQAIQDGAMWVRQWKRIEDPNRAWMTVKQLSEVCLAQPSVDSLTDLDAHDFRNNEGAAQPSRQIDLAYAARLQLPLDQLGY